MSESSPTPDAIHSDAFLARLMRDQLKLSIACALCFAVALVALPLLNYYQPAFMAQRVFGHRARGRRSQSRPGRPDQVT